MGPKLGIIAGGGELPARLIEVCRGDGREVFVLAFEGQTDPATVEDVEHAWIRLGQGGSALEVLRVAGVAELVMVGSIERPSFKALRPDLRTVRFFTKAGVKSLGDDGLLSAVVAEIEEEGFRVIGPDDILKDLVAPPGCYGSVEPDEQARLDIERGVAAAKALGTKDEGHEEIIAVILSVGVAGFFVSLGIAMAVAAYRNGK